MNDDSFYSPEADGQFVLSYELICLLQWLMDHDAEKLKKIVTKALSTGLQKELLAAKETEQNGSLEEIQESIIDFFGMFEALLSESLNEHAVKKAMEKNLFPTIDQIDSTICDNATVRFSVEKATSNIDSNPEENPKDLLFKELLRRWKPDKKNVLN